MEKSVSNKNIIHGGKLFFLLLLMPLVFSCNPVKYVPRDQTLLNSNYIEINREGMKKSDLSPYIKQKPNKKIFGARFHLWLYNLSNIEKQKWPHGWLRRIGEEPVIFDSYSKDQSRNQLDDYIAS
ncbi:MAG TPA: hypothetical protein PKY14_03795, partial [Bacteroidales bacterium]|nr:hypothetical protein [Bacteroidales bacterium]